MKNAIKYILITFTLQLNAQDFRETNVGLDTLDYKKLTLQVISFNMNYLRPEFSNPKLKPNYLVFHPSGSPSYLKFSDSIENIFVETKTSPEIFSYYKKRRNKKEGDFLCLHLQETKCIKDYIEFNYFFSFPVYNKRTKRMIFGELSTIRAIVKYKDGVWRIEELIRDH